MYVYVHKFILNAVLHLFILPLPRTGMLPKSSAKGRVRHASCSTASYSCSSPYHIGRLSFSTNSLKRKADLSLRRMGSLQRLGGRSNNTLNYLPCVDREPVIEEHASPAPEPVAKQTHPEKPAITPAWMRNYVPSVETERLFGRLNGSTSQPEVQLRPGAIQQPEDTVVQMYTFRPVSGSARAWMLLGSVCSSFSLITTTVGNTEGTSISIRHAHARIHARIHIRTNVRMHMLQCTDVHARTQARTHNTPIHTRTHL